MEVGEVLLLNFMREKVILRGIIKVILNNFSFNRKTLKIIFELFITY